MAKRKGFFGQEPIRDEDTIARQREVEALLAPRRMVAQDIPVERIEPNPFQARRAFPDIEDLAQIIRLQGFITRLRVRPHPTTPGLFQLVFGERRLRAAREAGLASVPCEIGDHNDAEMIEIGLAENIQRRDLDPLEEAQAFQAFIEQRGYTIRSLAERIGKDKSYVESRLALLKTPDDVQQMVVQRPDTIRAAREIAKLKSPEERQPLIEGIVTGTLSKEDVRGMVRTLAEERPAPPTAPHRKPTAEQRHALERDLRTVQTIFARWQQWRTDPHHSDHAAIDQAITACEQALAAIRTTPT